MLRPEKLPSNNLRSDFAASWSKLVCKKTVTITEEDIRTVFERFGGTSQIVLVDENFFLWGGGGGEGGVEGVSRYFFLGWNVIPSLSLEFPIMWKLPV